MNEYTEEFYRLNTRVNLQETEIQLVSKYINGLRDQIKDELSLRTVWTLSNVVNLALKVEIKQTKQFQKPTYSKKTYIETQHSKTISHSIPTSNNNHPFSQKSQSNHTPRNQPPTAPNYHHNQNNPSSPQTPIHMQNQWPQNAISATNQATVPMNVHNVEQLIWSRIHMN